MVSMVDYEIRAVRVQGLTKVILLSSWASLQKDIGEFMLGNPAMD